MCVVPHATDAAARELHQTSQGKAKSTRQGHTERGEGDKEADVSSGQDQR